MGLQEIGDSIRKANWASGMPSVEELASMPGKEAEAVLCKIIDRSMVSITGKSIVFSRLWAQRAEYIKEHHIPTDGFKSPIGLYAIDDKGRSRA